MIINEVNAMKKTKTKYIFIDIILFIILSLITLFFSKLDFHERVLVIGIMLFLNW